MMQPILIGLAVLLSKATAGDIPPIPCKGDAGYEATFRGTWNTQTSYGVVEEPFIGMGFASSSFMPQDPHFGPLVGVSHSEFEGFSLGSTASSGLQMFVETGPHDELLTELVQSGTPIGPSSGRIEAEGVQSVQASLSSSASTISIVTAVTPSPDWFLLGSIDLCDYETGKWKETADVDARAFDAGTDDGMRFTAANSQVTDPQGKITQLGFQKIGKFMFVKSTPCMGSRVYEVTFDATWNEQTSYGVVEEPYTSVGLSFDSSDFMPSTRSFGPLVTVSHNMAFTGFNGYFTTGSEAKEGLQTMAEGGANDAALLVTNLNDLGADSGVTSVAGPGNSAILHMGSQSLHARVGCTTVECAPDEECEPTSCDNSMITVVSSIIPSPDWFMKASIDMCDHETGDWKDVRVLDGEAFDAGTESGASFTLTGGPTVDGRISPLGFEGMGRFKFKELRICEGTPTYAVTFEGNWNSATTYGVEEEQFERLKIPSGNFFPALDAQFSPLIGASHNNVYSGFSVGAEPSTGLKSLFEPVQGDPATLSEELKALAENAEDVFSVAGPSANYIGPNYDFGAKSHVVHAMVGPDNSMISVLTMIMPSPDWFLRGSADMCDYDTGKWRDSDVKDALAFDAGTSSDETTFLEDYLTELQKEQLTKTLCYELCLPLCESDCLENFPEGQQLYELQQQQEKEEREEREAQYAGKISPLGFKNMARFKFKKLNMCEGAPTYSVEFQGSWNTLTTYGLLSDPGFPADPHFSPLVGASHNMAFDEFTTGSTALDGLKKVAETGETSDLVARLSGLRDQADSDIFSVVSPGLGRIEAEGFQMVHATVGSDHSFISVVTMIAPSPDWFLKGSADMCDYDTGKWKPSVLRDARAFDAGTDSGTQFAPTPPTPENAPNEEKISALLFENQGSFHFKKLNLCQGTQTYDVTFTGSRVGDVSGFSPLIGASHGLEFDGFAVGSMASDTPGLQEVAETGDPSVLKDHLEGLATGEVVRVVGPGAGPISGTGSQTVHAKVGREIDPDADPNPTVPQPETPSIITVVSMIASSKDLFVKGSADMCDYNTGQWKNTFSVDARAYDAGTVGVLGAAENEKIKYLFSNQGRFYFKKLKLCKGTQDYEITLQGTWNDQTSYGIVEERWQQAGVAYNFLPIDPTFGSLVGAAHSTVFSRFSTGTAASPGLKAVAEEGDTSALVAALKGDDAVSLVGPSIGRIQGEDSQTVLARVGCLDSCSECHCDNSMISVVTNIGPSPDWFLKGSADMCNYETGEWFPKIEQDGEAFDAGTRDGDDFTGSQQTTQAGEKITPLGFENMASFTFEKFLACKGTPTYEVTFQGNWGQQQMEEQQELNRLFQEQKDLKEQLQNNPQDQNNQQQQVQSQLSLTLKQQQLTRQVQTLRLELNQLSQQHIFQQSQQQLSQLQLQAQLQLRQDVSIDIQKLEFQQEQLELQQQLFQQLTPQQQQQQQSQPQLTPAEQQQQRDLKIQQQQQLHEQQLDNLEDKHNHQKVELQQQTNYGVFLQQEEVDPDFMKLQEEQLAQAQELQVQQLKLQQLQQQLQLQNGITVGPLYTPHFSPLVGATHGMDYGGFSSGVYAKNGLQKLAETGNPFELVAELELEELIGHTVGPGMTPIDGEGSQSVLALMGPDSSIISVVTMIAPSPDWFLKGSADMCDHRTGEWIEEEVLAAGEAHDAGTDEGRDFESFDEPSFTPVPIQTLSHFENMGMFTFKLVDTSPVLVQLNNYDGEQPLAQMQQQEMPQRAPATGFGYVSQTGPDLLINLVVVGLRPGAKGAVHVLSGGSCEDLGADMLKEAEFTATDSGSVTVEVDLSNTGKDTLVLEQALGHPVVISSEQIRPGGPYAVISCGILGAAPMAPPDCNNNNNLPTMAPTGPTCTPNPTFNAGHGGCSTYGPGQVNHDYCQEDGAVSSCCEACADAIACTDSPDWDGGWQGAGCPSYAKGFVNHQHCETDGATLHCCEACSSGKVEKPVLTKLQENCVIDEDPFCATGWDDVCNQIAENVCGFSPSQGGPQ